MKCLLIKISLLSSEEKRLSVFVYEKIYKSKKLKYLTIKKACLISI